IIMKNLMDFAIGTPLFWLTGFGIMFGGAGAFMGGFDPLVRRDYSGILPAGVPLPAYLIFQTVFCATAATIMSGAMAERTKFISYCIYSAVISAVVYPVSGHWIWGGGWLARMGFHDFAGSTAVHMCGGVAALIGARVLGPRIGKYKEDGKPNAILGHSLTLGALGVFILWFCWFGFNGCSTVAMDSDAAVYSAGNIFVTTNLAAATATVATMIITWLRYGKPDISMTLNGSLAGLVAITAGCDMVSPAGAFFIGLIAAFVVVFGIEFIDKVCRIDDPVGAIGVHGMCGAAGTLLTGVFAVDEGLMYGGGFSFLGIQLIGVVSVILWVSVTMIIVFNVLKHTIGLRASVEEETKGLDVTEHNLASSYADFMPMVFMGKQKEYAADAGVSVEKAVPVEHYPSAKPVSASVKLSKVVMIFNQSRFTALKDALTDLGVTGMTITQVMGCGTQKGHVNYYRGIQVEEAALLPKMKLEVVVSRVPVEDIIETARKALYTGKIGDGKIFVYDVENVMKVRTGEQGYDALQGE
ncbi:MAG: ammonium transporter, partial [Clostridia bacterium]|nr:ammonium transporter [Clostridia bacterium]